MTDASEAAGLVTEDAFLGGRLRLRQPARGYRAGIDAVLLAAAVPVAADQTTQVLDAGAGVGTAGLCVARRCAQAHVVLLEREPGFAELAAQNIAINSLGQRARLVRADLLAPAADLLAVGLAPASFGHVIANPPFHDAEAGTPAQRAPEANANAMVAGDLERWGRFLARMTAAGGGVTLIHKADALAAVLSCLDGRFGAVRVLPVAPRPGTAAIRILVQGVKGSRAPLRLLAPLTLHEETGHRFRRDVVAVLKDGAALALVG